MVEAPRFNIRQIQHAFSDAAKRYDDHAQLQQDVLEECVSLGKECWDKSATILDLGCGTGMLAKKSSWNIYGADLAFSMCEVARGNGELTVTAVAEFLPFADASFDGVFSSLMLQWSNNPLAYFKEIYRVTKPGGRCIISTFAYGTLAELQTAFATIDNTKHINEFGPPNYFSALAAHAGFRMLICKDNVYTEHYETVKDIMRNLKIIGASSKESGSRKGLTTPRQFDKLEQTYRKNYADKNGLPVSWNILIMMLEKP